MSARAKLKMSNVRPNSVRIMPLFSLRILADGAEVLLATQCQKRRKTKMTTPTAIPIMTAIRRTMLLRTSSPSPGLLIPSF
jgi:hypothetical protein